MRIIVTGANSGVGKATAAALAAAGHSVVIACRTIPKGERAAAEMAGDVEVRHLDLADLTSVRTFADSADSVDVLVNNAGVSDLPLTRTRDGFEAHMVAEAGVLAQLGATGRAQYDCAHQTFPDWSAMPSGQGSGPRTPAGRYLRPTLIQSHPSIGRDCGPIQRPAHKSAWQPKSPTRFC